MLDPLNLFLSHSLFVISHQSRIFCSTPHKKTAKQKTNCTLLLRFINPLPLFFCSSHFFLEHFLPLSRPKPDYWILRFDASVCKCHQRIKPFRSSVCAVIFSMKNRNFKGIIPLMSKRLCGWEALSNLRSSWLAVCFGGGFRWFPIPVSSTADAFRLSRRPYLQRSSFLYSLSKALVKWI